MGLAHGMHCDARRLGSSDTRAAPLLVLPGGAFRFGALGSMRQVCHAVSARGRDIHRQLATRTTLLVPYCILAAVSLPFVPYCAFPMF